MTPALALALFLAPAAPLPARVTVAVRAKAAPPDEEAEYSPGEPPAWVSRALVPFPPRDVVRSWCRFQRAYGSHLDKLRGMRPNDFWLWHAAERHWGTYRLWHLLETAQDPCAGANFRAECLSRLRKELGRAAFGRGAMPPPVDVRDFDRAD